MVEPSNDEQAAWPNATRAYVADLLARVADLERRHTVLRLELFPGGATLEINPSESDVGA